MSLSRRSPLFALFALFGLFLAAFPASAAIDSIAVDARSPASPATLRGRTHVSPWTATNSVEVVFHYNLDSTTTGYVGIFTGVPPNASHTGLETVFEISEDGPGKGAKRFSVLCDGKSPVYEIKRIKVALMTIGPVGPVTLATKFLDVDYTFQCRGANPLVRADNPPFNPTVAPTPAKLAVVARPAVAPRPNITSAAPSFNIWGSNPAKLHKVDWGSLVGLKATESITPNEGTGPCAFYVEYYEKEANGVATGPFKNTIYSDAGARATNGPDSLGPREMKPVSARVQLDSGPHVLKIVLDADGNVSESNELDNSFSVRYVLDGRCGQPPGSAPPVR